MVFISGEKTVELVYPRERTLFAVLAALSGIIWLALIIGTLGIALLYVLLFFVIYLFAQSGFIAHIRGTGVLVSAEQFPDIHRRVLASCTSLGIEKVPDCYVLRTDFFNALATRFLGRNYIVLFSDVVDALESKPDALDFYIGHELGHIHRSHLVWGPFLAPAKLLPVLGAGYSRACEYTCDRYGARCCYNEADATAAIAAIAAGSSLWKTMNAAQYSRQQADTNGFWMSFHELTGGYPWLTKRFAHVLAYRRGQRYEPPRRNAFAWVLSMFVPNIGGSVAGLLFVVALIGVLAAIALPAFQDYVNRANASSMNSHVEQARRSIEDYVVTNQQWPTGPADVGLSHDSLQGGTYVVMVKEGGDIVVTTSVGRSATIAPYVEDGVLRWSCEGDLTILSGLAACEPIADEPPAAPE